MKINMLLKLRYILPFIYIGILGIAYLQQVTDPKLADCTGYGVTPCATHLEFTFFAFSFVGYIISALVLGGTGLSQALDLGEKGDGTLLRISAFIIVITLYYLLGLLMEIVFRFIKKQIKKPGK